MDDAQAPRSSGPDRRGALEAFLSLVGSFSGYLQARLELAGLESREAGLRLLAFAIFLGLAIVLLLGGYVFAVILVYALIQAWTGLSHIWMGVLFLGIHLVAAFLALLLAKNTLRRPFFPHSIQQLAKDRAWLNRSQMPNGPKA